MACPDCCSSRGESGIFTSVETHGLECGPYEIFSEEWILCLDCGVRFDMREWSAVPEAGDDT